MTTRPSNHRRRAALRLFAGALIGAGVVAAASQSASAAVTATFTNGVLTVFGDGLDNNIQISRDAAGKLTRTLTRTSWAIWAGIVATGGTNPAQIAPPGPQRLGDQEGSAEVSML
jgi:hypothetical protein